MRYFYKKFLFIFAIIAVAFSSLFLFSGNKSLEISNCETSAEILNLENQNLTEQNEISAYEDSVNFEEFQGEIHIEEVNLNVDKPYIVCSSYNAG